MTALEPKASDTGRYSKTEAAGLLGVSIKTLDRYTASGMIKCGYRRANGRRFYTGKEIKRFWLAQ